MTTMRGTVLCGFLAASLFGQAPAKPPKTPILVSPSILDAVVAITPPPALDSPKMSKDLAEIFAIHRSPAPQEIEKANWDNEHENIWAIAKVLGDKFTAESLPATAALWADVNNDQSMFVSAAKKHFQHPRPFDLDPAVQSVCGMKPGSPKNSYPSGHGTMGYVSALLLSMMAPEKAAVLHARADEYAHNRVVCGDHYAADALGSRESAGLVVGNMLASPRFQQEFAAAKAEVRRALGLQSM
jgi:acid phosphatase (class A)